MSSLIKLFFSKKESVWGMLGAFSVIFVQQLFQRYFSDKNKSAYSKRVMRCDKNVTISYISTETIVASNNAVFTIVVDADDDFELKNINKLVNATLLNVKKEDEIAIVINSPGGSVLDFYAAYDQLNRLKSTGAKVNVFIKKIAASGGYLLASLGDTIYGTENCIAGSIGVFRSGFNFNKLLENLSIAYRTYKSCEYKNVGDPFDPLTDSASEKQQKDVIDIHNRFTATIKKHRKNINDELFNGDTWYGDEAKENGLIDEIKTIDDYIMEKSKSHQVYNVSVSQKSNEKFDLMNLVLKLF